MSETRENELTRKKGEKLSREKEDYVLDVKEKIDNITSAVLDEVLKFPEKERYLALGRVINSLVDFAYKPMITEYLQAKSRGDV